MDEEKRAHGHKSILEGRKEKAERPRENLHGSCHRRRARAFRAFNLKAHFVVLSIFAVHLETENREEKNKKKIENKERREN